MKNKKIYLIFVFIFAVLAVNLLLYLQVWNPSWNPFRPSPTITLAKMAFRMKRVDAFHALGEVKLEMENIIVSSEFDLDLEKVNDNQSKIKGSFKIPMFSERVEFLTMNDVFYLNPGPYAINIEEMTENRFVFGDYKWIKIDQESLDSLSDSEISKTHPILSMPEEEWEKLTEEIIKLFTERKYYEIKAELEDEEIDGEMYYHYLISLNEEEIQRMANRLDFVSEYFADYQSNTLEDEIKIGDLKDLDFEVWIDQDDYYLYQIKYEENDGSRSLVTKINFSDFNQEQNINPPEEFVEIGEILEKIEE